MRPVRVLHLINGEYFGGSARVLMNYLGSPQRTSDVAVGVLFPGELERRCREMDVRTELLPMAGRLDLRATRSVLRLARSHRADLIHTHQVRNTLLGRLASMVKGRPVVTHVHSPAFRESASVLRNRLSGGVDRVLARRTARFIAVSSSLATELANQGIPRDKIRMVANGIPMPNPPAAGVEGDVRREFGIPTGVSLVGMVANLRPRKGAELLLAATAELARSGFDLHVMLVGQPFREFGRDYGLELRLLVDRLGLGPRVTLTGYRSDIDRLMSAIDVFVLPSLFGEGMPMVLLEAMGMGLPVITTSVEGIPEVVTAGEDGILVPPGDSQALATAIRRLVGDAGLRRRLGSAARRTLIAKFTADRMARGIDEVYAELGAVAD